MHGKVSTKVTIKDAVADDRNWVGRIQNQLVCTKNWNSQWGFLAGGLSNIDPQKVTAKFSVDQRIKQLQTQISCLQKAGHYGTTNMIYGTGQSLQLFSSNKHNIHQSKQLRALQRRLPKNWKKPKWTAPQDPFDDLKNLYKKKK